MPRMLVIMNKIQVLSAPRMGSTYLYAIIHNYMGADDKLYWELNEPFNLVAKQYNEDNFSNIFKTIQSPKCIFKMHVSHLRYLDIAHQNEYKHILDDFTTVVLIRKNILDTIVSQALAVNTGEWNYYTDTSPVSLSYNEIKDVASHVIENYKLLIENPYDIVYNKVLFYEDLGVDTTENFLKTGLPLSDINTCDITNKIQMSPSQKNIKDIVNLSEIHDWCLEIIDDVSISGASFKGAILNIDKGKLL